MSLTYTDISSVQISREEGFRISTVNSVIRRLIENDQSFFNGGASPGVWERRWYNDAGNSGLYYKKGDAVWINTEQADDFVAAHAADLQMYAQGRSDTRYRLLSLSAAQDVGGIYGLFKEMALGLGDFAGEEIYYLGNLLEPVQIRVSLSDDNDRPPSDNAYWADFFDRSKNEAYYRNLILSAAEEQLQAVYEKHLKEYHLSGLSDPRKFYSEYLRSDLANISKFQKFVNHAWYQPDMEGFDHVLRFVVKDLGNGQRQWFRIWKSGLLEHGGMVVVAGGASDCGTNDYQARLYSVNLAWQYDGKTAPVYDFPTAGIGGFYSQDSQIYTGSGTADYSPAVDALGSSRRYVVDISPVQSLDSSPSGAGPYPAVQCDRFLRYPGKEVTKLNNSSFTFAYAPSTKMYSYYAKGFTATRTRSF